jgi:hypothetical protein
MGKENEMKIRSLPEIRKDMDFIVNFLEREKYTMMESEAMVGMLSSYLRYVSTKTFFESKMEKMAMMSLLDLTLPKPSKGEES